MLNIPNESLQDYVQHIGSLMMSSSKYNVMVRIVWKMRFLRMIPNNKKMDRKNHPVESSNKNPESLGISYLYCRHHHHHHLF